MKHDDNSYEQYKKYLETSLGISSIPAPKAPMNPYLRFFLQRSSEERSKGEKDVKDLAKSLSEQWKNLSANKKEYYQKIYTIRLREKNALLQEYLFLTGKHKIMPPYARFVKKRYAQYSKEYKNSNSSEINKLVKNDWKTLSQKEKTKLEDQYEKQKNDANLDIDNSDRIAQYHERLQKYHELLSEDKEKILKKYGFTKQNKAKLRKIEKEQERLKKNAQRQLAREQRQREIRQQKQKIREAKLKKLRQQKETARKLKEQQKQKEKDQKQKAKIEQADQKKKQVEKGKKQKAKKGSAKEIAKPAASKSKAKTVQKPQAKKPEVKKNQKTKLIKKSATKETKKGKESAKGGKGSKTKAKAKGKGGKGKGAKRGRKGK